MSLGGSMRLQDNINNLFIFFFFYQDEEKSPQWIKKINSQIKKPHLKMIPIKDTYQQSRSQEREDKWEWRRI